MLKGVRDRRILMYSYHIVAKLRQFRGVSAAMDPRIHRRIVTLSLEKTHLRERFAAGPA